MTLKRTYRRIPTRMVAMAMNMDSVMTPMFSFVAGFSRSWVKPSGAGAAGVFHTSVPGGSGGAGAIAGVCTQVKELRDQGKAGPGSKRRASPRRRDGQADGLVQRAPRRLPAPCHNGWHGARARLQAKSQCCLPMSLRLLHGILGIRIYNPLFGCGKHHWLKISFVRQ